MDSESVHHAAQQPTCNRRRLKSNRLSARLSFLDRFDFTESGESGELPNAPDDLGEMHGWLAIALNDTSIFQGFHDWHQDGPAVVGRFHKAFVMVSKNRSTARPTGGPALNHANLVALPAYERYQRNCQILGKDGDAWQDLANPLSCTGDHAKLAPGDVLFFREDVHHRTQDSHIDRVSLIIDIHRQPLRDAPDVKIDAGSQHVQSKRTNEGNDVTDTMLEDTVRDQRPGGRHLEENGAQFPLPKAQYRRWLVRR